MSVSGFPEGVSADENVREVAEPAAAPWPFPKRFALCAAFIFFVLVNWPFPFYLIPYAGRFVTAPVDRMWQAVVPAVATALFHVSADGKPNGSGDTTWNYVQLAIWLICAVMFGAVWAALMRRRAQNERTYEIFRIFLRYALAASMVSYGVLKVIQLQFPRPWLERLVQPFGTSSPMGILWTFMGVSRAYNFLTGAAETLAGVLLTTRRTTFLGGLLAIAVVGNIVALNFCYDVPVKLYSSELLMMAIIIVMPDGRGLFDFFLRRRQQPLFSRAALETASLVVRTLLVAAFLLMSFYEAGVSRRTYGELAPRSPLRGIWNVDVLTDNGAPRPPLQTDVQRWRRVVFDHPVYNSILLMNDLRQRYTVALDEKKKTVTWTGRDDPKRKFTLAYTRPDPNTLVLDGMVAGRTLHAICHRAPPTSELLLTRGFHWINESPFNR